MKFSPSLSAAFVAFVTLTGGVYGAGRLPTPSCDDPVNREILHRCDPYVPQLLYVDSRDLDRGVSQKRFPIRLQRVEKPKIRTHLGEGTLLRRWIRREERLLRAKQIGPVDHHRKVPTHSTPRIVSPKVAFAPSKYSGLKVPGKINTRSGIPLRPQGRKEGRTAPKNGPIEVQVAVRITPSRKAPTVESSGNEGIEAIEIETIPGAVPAPMPPEKTEEETPQLRSAPVSSPAPLPETLIHTVESGETLIGLARRFGTTPYDIRKWNHLSSDHLFKVGERLVIHPGRKSSPDEIRLARMRERSGKYKVCKGDSLIGLAKRFGVSVESICRLNKIDKKRPLRLGEILFLPISQKKLQALLRKEKRKRLEALHKREALERNRRLQESRRLLQEASIGRFRHRIRVVATAYTSHYDQTDRTPFIAAWNNRIRPGMKIIAVSPDLIRKYGITNGTRVRISGLPGIYTVRDKMNPRLRNHIDIYMGLDRRRALRWGRRRVYLYW
ncbi:LysM peptidoglycan-binding domain-containing protein [Nitratifractor sp.]